MEILQDINPSALVFYGLATLIVASAAGVALSRNILYAGFSLLGTLGGVAGLYLYLGADFLGIAQLIIYVGGILVLILFAVLLTNRIGDMKITNASVSQPKMTRPVPSSTSSFAVGGCRAPDSTKSATMMLYPYAPYRSMKPTATVSRRIATLCARRPISVYIM